jgi:DNA-binding beta-propeller fold protein YncE
MVHEGSSASSTWTTFSFRIRTPATSIPGEIDQYSAQTGKFLGALVPHSDNLNAPYAPRGIIIAPDNGTLYVADMGPDFPDCVEPCGAVKQFDVNTGQFRGNLHFTTVNGEFRPRGLVFGPDGLLYVSLFSERDPTVGFVVSYNRGTGVDKLVASYTTESDCTKHLHRPEGLAFGPDGSLYVTTFRKDSTDIDRILIFNRRTGACLDEIDLDQPAQPRAFAQALVFGPGGSLVVPITGNGPDTGAVRLYDVTKKTFPFTNFLPPSMDAGPLGSPWYLSFGKTSPVTLTYRN